MSTAKPCKMRRRPTPLTPEQQQLAAEAWSHVAAMAAEAERQFPLTCASAQVAVRITRAIPTFDPRLSSLKTWAKMQARGAILDAQRATVPPGVKRGQPVPRTEPLALMRNDDDPALVFDPPPEWEEMEAVRYWLRGLLPEERAAVLDSIVGEEPLPAIGERHGICKSRVSQLRTAALEQLRYARPAEYAEWRGRESS